MEERTGFEPVARLPRRALESKSSALSHSATSPATYSAQQPSRFTSHSVIKKRRYFFETGGLVPRGAALFFRRYSLTAMDYKHFSRNFQGITPKTAIRIELDANQFSIKK